MGKDPNQVAEKQDVTTVTVQDKAVDPDEVIPKAQGPLALADGQDFVVFREPGSGLRLFAVRSGKKGQKISMLRFEDSPRAADALAEMAQDPTNPEAEGAFNILQRAMMPTAQFHGVLRAIGNGTMAALTRQVPSIRKAITAGDNTPKRLTIAVTDLPKSIR